MGLCILGMGECGSTSTTTNNLTATTVNQVLTNMVNTTSQSVKAIQINLQTANVTFGNIKGGCTDIGNIKQEISADQTIKVYLDLSNTQSLQNQVSTALKNATTTSNDQTQGFLTTASTDANTYNNINDYINNLTSTNITNKTVQELNSIIKNAQSANPTFKDIDCTGQAPGTSTNIGNVTQTMIVKQIVDVLLKAVIGQTSENIIENTVDQTAETINKQDNSGFGGMITDIIGKLSGLLGGALLGTLLCTMMPCIVIICIACALCGGGHHFGNKRSQFGKGKKSK